ncbi:MAG TPA: phage virion morphogenesis protein [Armatimonadota bacterium]|jgi:phage gpG-like protein
MAGYGAGDVRLSIEVEGEKQLTARVKGVIDRTKDLRPVFDELEADFREHMGEVFGSEGAAQKGGKWQALSPRYAAWKARHYPGRPILERTGALKDSLTTGLTVEKGPGEMTLSSAVRYGIYHQSRRPRKSNLPRRPIINLPQSVTTRWRAMLVRALWQEE